MFIKWIALLLVFPLIYIIVENQKKQRNKTNSNSASKQKDALDAILKNNKDRYQA